MLFLHSVPTIKLSFLSDTLSSFSLLFDILSNKIFFYHFGIKKSKIVYKIKTIKFYLCIQSNNNIDIISKSMVLNEKKYGKLSLEGVQISKGKEF